ncbi:hypothetical protein [Pseudomonas sp. Irchel 3E19]|uniref:hypothetical protein n=1 Tax=Pseudomonas sp. Irchel 3E19 TaxID=2008981 RepID=UPI000BA35F3A|nr:hypothetical protein [Pseudomonas sp. Irchel 3E19]
MIEVIQGRWSFDDFKRWTRGESNAELFGDLYSEDPDAVDLNILGECRDAGLLELILNPNCRERLYFASLLVLSLCNVFRSGRSLPFQFSRFLGIVSREIYFEDVMQEAKRVYEKCEVINSMSASNDPAIQSFYKQMMDFRHGEVSLVSDFYLDCTARFDLKLFDDPRGSFEKIVSSEIKAV